ncbi:MAG TPA: beta-ketoacyl synthase N-terminal-like domain-containing protein [Longimicrobium sp.]|jgi:acyl transferase domain-containing protein/acyl carrier protein
MSGNALPAAGYGAAIAIVGMAGRFPGARDVDEFWSNLRGGVEGITFFTEEELRAAGVSPALLANPHYVRASGAVDGMELFDAAFFGFSPREAEVMDPQHRVFLETAWEALENAGHGPGTTTETVGVYAGSSASSYLGRHVGAHPEVVEAVGGFQLSLANSKDFVATRAAHKLNLCGPALNVQTGCSTGLVAVHLACQALAAGECDLAVAGGVSLHPAQREGYLYSPSGIGSPDGHCRAFDVHSAGTVGGFGVALVVLRRLADALADGDTIRAVVRGSAVNNDGAQKVGFTAPSVEGQAAVIEEALAVAGVPPETVGYVEGHGSGTDLGDPVEVAALAQAFGPAPRRQSCVLGSVKTSIGHLDAAAGAAGLIKTALAVEHGEIPPTLHFTAPNPRIDFASTPFYVSAELRPWPAGATPRRAGVSSFGIGGTNAHVVLEQAPPAPPRAPSRPWQLLTLSARTPAALEAATDRLAAHLRAHPEQALADVAWTLQAGRRAWEHRRALVARDPADAAAALEARAPDRLIGGEASGGARPVDFLFPGVGSHYPGMGRGLYDAVPAFRETVDRCAELLLPRLGVDLREVLYPAGAPAEEEGPVGVDLRAMLRRGAGAPDPAAERLNGTRLAQPALFVVEYALARLWMRWGARPRAMIGHSLGEYVAATVAGVWSLEDALMLVAERARLIEELPEGGMMGVALPDHEVRPLLRDGLCVGTLNGPGVTVVSGPPAALDALAAELAERGVVVRRLPARHAFHSAMMRPVAERLEALMRGVRLRPPAIPFVSNVTGEWIRASEATDPAYWARHLCETVRFADGVRTLAADRRAALLEVGPGHTLRALVAQLDCWDGDPPAVVATLRHDYERHPDLAHLLGAAGRLWAAGVAVDWAAVHDGERPRRVPLPTYPFERRRYWLEPRRAASPDAGASPASPAAGAPDAAGADPAEWLYLPTWTRAPLPPPAPGAAEPAAWLVLADGAGIGAALAGRLEALGHRVTVVRAGGELRREGDRGYTVRPGSADDLAALRQMLRAAGEDPRRVVLLWGIDPAGEGAADAFERAQARGYGTVAALAAAFAEGDGGPLDLLVVTESARDVAGGERVHPERATVAGACAALPRRHPGAACRTVDVHLREGSGGRLVEQLLAEATAGAQEPEAALRGPLRWARAWRPVRTPGGAAGAGPVGALLFTGSLARGAGELAAHLAGSSTPVALVVPPSFPGREAWDAHLASAPAGDPAAAAIRAARAGEAGGGRTLLFRAAADDAAALRAALDEAREAFGALRGVVHGLGAEDDAPDGEDGDGTAGLVRAARGLAALEEATAGSPPGLVLLWSSLPPAPDEAGGAAPAAACALADAWAERRAAEGDRWTSVAWDRWRVDGEPAGRGIDPGEGARAFERLFALAAEPRVAVSPRDPGAPPVGGLAPRAAPAPASAPAEAAFHPRPALDSDYHAPAGAAEEILVDAWRELLGIAEIGVHDDFFQLGGHSLLGMQLISRVRETFGVELPLRAIFHAPTVAGMAALIDEAILLKLEDMSEEEAMNLMGGSVA